MKKMKKIFLVLIALLITFYAISSANALTYEGSTGINEGGPKIYPAWFNDDSGVLAVATLFENNSGIVYTDITVIAICVDENRAFRLRIYDSDENKYVNPEKELSIGSIERTFSVEPHIDTNELVWSAIVASEDGLTIYASITLRYVYNPDAEYERVDDTKDTIDREDHEAALKKAKTEARIANGVLGVLGVVSGIAVIRRLR